MSSRFPTSELRRSLSSSIVSRNSRVASGVQSTSRCSRLVTDALIDASGVRRSCDTAASSAVRSSFASASPAAAATSARSRRRSTATCTCAANDRSTSRSSSRDRAAATTSTSCGRSSTEKVAVLGSRRAPARRRPPRSPTRRRSASRKHRDRRRRSNAARSWATSCGSGSSLGRQRAAERGERLGFGARPRRVGGPAARDGHEQAHDPADDEEHDEREEVLALGDRERVERRGEVEVREQRAR